MQVFVHNATGDNTIGQKAVQLYDGCVLDGAFDGRYSLQSTCTYRITLTAPMAAYDAATDCAGGPACVGIQDGKFKIAFITNGGDFMTLCVATHPTLQCWSAMLLLNAALADSALT